MDNCNEKQLKEIESELERCKMKLKELDIKTRNVDSIIQQIKYEKISESNYVN